MATQQSYYELYRGSSLGLSLTDTLDDLINEGRIEPQLAMKILSTFDKIVTEVLADKVRARLTFKGHLDTYRFCDEVWTFLIKDVSFKLDNQTTVTADKVKICRSSKLPILHPRNTSGLPTSIYIRFDIMPRTLPWLLDDNNNGRIKLESMPRKRVKRETETDADLTPKPPTSPKRDFFRSSQTPPTSPARPCPTEEFIREGLDKDDAWVMVEDEFYAIAQKFTQHLHYAEYVRRKKEAKAQSASAIADLERPTDGQTHISKSLQLKKDAELLAARQKEGLAQLEASGDINREEPDEEDDAWAGTHLHGLMTSPRKVRSLVGVQGVKSSTKAAAGFGQASSSSTDRRGLVSTSRMRSPTLASSRAAQSHVVDVGIETASEEDDDLDGEAHTTPRQLITRLDSSRRGIPEGPNQHLKSRKSDTSNTGTLKQNSTSQPSKQPAGGFKSRVQMLFDDLDELPESSKPNSSISGIKKDTSSGTQTPNKSNSDNSDNNLESKPRYKDVPTFLK
ncbi:Transcription initiation factor IIA gamma subunit [Penicillium angulare]|uniref:Transcription initiation factor IIA gamma subunit n=1 Tax=Penicillium angulare TaxID=116970 RepID=UPI00253FAB73|nr:Transcription initiation factor IIA gamma subunit [Penicillium angulare]KAJ5279179.1 Transcription initiation factor IIA gamma subunit [Penicillium angulare]